MVFGGNRRRGDNVTAETLYVFESRPASKIISIFSKMMDNLPEKIVHSKNVECWWKCSNVSGAIGGKCFVGIGNDIYEYNAKDNEWSCVQSETHVPCTRFSAKACNLGGTIFICGGHNPYHAELLRYDADVIKVTSTASYPTHPTVLLR